MDSNENNTDLDVTNDIEFNDEFDEISELNKTSEHAQSVQSAHEQTVQELIEHNRIENNLLKELQKYSIEILARISVIEETKITKNVSTTATKYSVSTKRTISYFYEIK